MKDYVLLVLNARMLPECIDAIRHLSGPKFWLTGYTEKELEEVIPKLVSHTDYNYYVLLSDDTKPEQRAYREVLRYCDGERPVITGYSNLRPGSNLVNLSKSPLRGTFPGPLSYDFYTYEEVQRQPPIFISYFAGWSLTAVRRDILLQSGYKTYQGWGSDFMFSMWCNKNNVPIIAVRDAFVYHLATKEKFIVGKVPKSTALTNP